MAEITRPAQVVPDNLPPEDVPKWLRLIIDWVAQQIIKVQKDILKDPRFSDKRTASGLDAMENVVSLDTATAPNPGDVLYAKDRYNAVWGAPGAPSPTDPGSGPTVVGTHTILDGGTVHTDTAADTVTKGSLIVGNSTPAWDELVVGTDGHVLTADSTQTLGVKWAAGAAAEVELLHIYGNGPDGAITLNGGAVDGFTYDGGTKTYTQLRHIFATDFTIDATYTLNPGACGLWCSGTFTNNGTVSRVGSAGSAGTAATSGTSTGGAGGTGTTQAEHGGSTTGGTGRAGTTGNGTTGTAAVAATGEGGSGGNGGAGEDGLSTTGGGAGTQTANTIARMRMITPIYQTMFSLLIQGGGGGRGGSSGGGGTEKGGAGGGGGGGGGVWTCFARFIVNNGTFTLAGGAGGAGGAGSASAGAGGGGGGGGGGFMVLAYDTLTAGTISVAGGAGGAAGATGGSGAGASAGAAGSAGTLVKYCRLTGVFS